MKLLFSTPASPTSRKFSLILLKNKDRNKWFCYTNFLFIVENLNLIKTISKTFSNESIFKSINSNLSNYLGAYKISFIRANNHVPSVI